ncbi:hypothetical protein [Haloarcula salinisoli]|uniref:Uncharacterized protein n=1 Tax=Haloarcula salinisoli TaxID=2487746 RepID=A0A8J8C741_9EURY|nr:hypothetical protein [Halomicroarcula salinisoli]MBX0285563.1 hypothetical protein [Halomicroarcula salinisoli]MBX0302951.1 hypothetical protein [Halomicroarcula salinisoli]
MTDTIQKAAMALGGGLMVLGTAGLGIVEMLAGEPYGAAPLTNEAGAVIATPAVDPVLRTGLVLAGLAVLGLYAAYAAVTADEAAEQATAAETMAD